MTHKNAKGQREILQTQTFERTPIKYLSSSITLVSYFKNAISLIFRTLRTRITYYEYLLI